jgi:hemoglobin-like flavoprotein
MIQDILKSKPSITIKNNNTINLGYQNGWMFSDMPEIYKAFKQYMVPDSYKSETVANCVTEYSFMIDDGIDRYSVVSRVDSGD